MSKYIKKENPQNNGGRPRKVVIDYKTLDGLCHIQCTGEEIASILEIDYDTLNENIMHDKGVGFSEYNKQKSDGGKASLRRRQWKLSETNPAMAIFLGKNLLKQSDVMKIDGNINIIVGIEEE